MKRKLCIDAVHGIDQKILLVQKQIHVLTTLQQDSQLAKILGESNAMIKKLNDEVNTSTFADTIRLIQESDANNEQLAQLLESSGGKANDAELEKEFQNLVLEDTPTLVTPPKEAPKEKKKEVIVA